MPRAGLNSTRPQLSETCYYIEGQSIRSPTQPFLPLTLDCRDLGIALAALHGTRDDIATIWPATRDLQLALGASDQQHVSPEPCTESAVAH
jgi:hypothetical protein